MKKTHLFLLNTLILGSVTLSGCDFISIVPAEIKTEIETQDPFIELSDKRLEFYYLGETYDDYVDNEGLSVYYVDPTNKNKSTKLYKTDYSYTLYDDKNNVIDATKPFDNVTTYTVKVSYKECIEKSLTFQLKNKDIDATSISLNKSYISLVEGDSEQLTVGFVPTYANSSVSWASSNNSVATVSDGLITAVKKGTAKITAKSASVTASVSVTVVAENEPILISKVTMTETSKTIYVGENVSLSATILPDNATNQVLTWASNSASIASVDSSTGVVTGVKAGQTIIKAKATDGSNKYASCTVTVKDVPVDPTSIDLDKETMDVNIGSSAKLTATILPSNANQNKDITWTSSDESVATVTNGTVKGISKGTAIITATTTLGLTDSCEVNVKSIAVTGVTLTETSKEVKVGSTFTLNYTVSPSNASNKNVSWSSTDETVAKISNGSITALKEGTATVTVTTEDGNKTDSCDLTVNEVVKDAWTILVYMCGSDLESDSSQGGAATEDLQEMASVSGQPDDVNVVVQAGGASSWKSTYSSVISSSKTNRFHLKNKSFVSDSQTSKSNMGKSQTLESFVTWGLETYPAEKVGLILWNHGGAMSGCCFDEQYSDDSLTVSEISSAITSAKTSAGYTDNLEFIGYDCCLMQVQDIASVNSRFANYMIASEESEWGYGWSYDKFFDDLFAKKTTETILKACVDGFKSETNSAYSSWHESNDQTLSYLNLTNFSAYETAWEDMSSYLSSNIVTSSTKWSTFTSVVNSAQKYGYSSDASSYNGGYAFDVFDVKDFLNKMTSSSSYKSNSTLMTKVSNCLTALSDVISYEFHGSGAGNSYGLAMFCPLAGYLDEDYYTVNDTKLTNWRSLCISYGSFYSGWSW